MIFTLSDVYLVSDTGLFLIFQNIHPISIYKGDYRNDWNFSLTFCVCVIPRLIYKKDTVIVCLKYSNLLNILTVDCSFVAALSVYLGFYSPLVLHH